jgi:hypothetical protein
MSSRIDWNIARPEEAPLPDGVEASPGPRRPRSRLRSPRFWAGYALVLALASVIGFGLGRWTEARASILEGLTGQLALEALARQRDDLELFVATLDPDADPDWLDARLLEFSQGAVLEESSLLDFRMLGSDRLELSLGPPGSAPDTPVLVTRHYRLVAGRWRWTAPSQ